MSKLPDKPSELIRLAVHDMKLVEADKSYVINMDVWHERNIDDYDTPKCEVCFAGCIMAQTLDKDLDDIVDINNDFSYRDHDKFHFLNGIREYNVEASCYNNRLVTDDTTIEEIDDKFNEVQRKMNHLKELSYYENPDIFKENMEEIASYFEEVGL